MPGYVEHLGASINCSHGGMVQVVPTNQRVLVSKQPVVTSADSWFVAGCPVVYALVPCPCVRIQWVAPATRVKVMGNPVICSGSTGLSISAIQTPQGSPIPQSQQTRVTAQ